LKEAEKNKKQNTLSKISMVEQKVSQVVDYSEEPESENEDDDDDEDDEELIEGNSEEIDDQPHSL
jgi:hypothetical protein